MIRPTIRIPLWAAVALPAAAYVTRSIIRGGDFRPDLPSDALAYSMLALVVLAVAIARSRASRADETYEQLTHDVHAEDDGPGDSG